MNNEQDFRDRDLAEAEEALGYSFRDRELLKTGLTHSSWANAHGGADNERLEFLGDAVLELIVTETLYRGSDSTEGTLTGIRQQYVSQGALEEAARRASLKNFMRFSGGAENVGGKTESNLFEAVLGAVYLDGGLKAARGICKRFLKFKETENYKTLLQEFVQEKNKMTPRYETKENAEGYVCTVSALGKSAEGQGASKKAAQTQAAKLLFEALTGNQKR